MIPSGWQSQSITPASRMMKLMTGCPNSQTPLEQLILQRRSTKPRLRGASYFLDKKGCIIKTQPDNRHTTPTTAIYLAAQNLLRLKYLR
jgi:hypothetical protein